jgi:hypothetical protein
MQLLDDIRTPECRAFAEAWQGWRGAELVPRRAAVRIEEIGKLLPLITVLELVSEDSAIFRLAGTDLFDALGIDLTGLDFYAMTTPETRAIRVARTIQAGQRPCGTHYLHPIVYQSGRTVPSEVVSLPVWPDDPTDPPQFFSISMALDETKLDGTVAEPRQLPIGDGYQFVDIGAGVPDEDLNLADRPPAVFPSSEPLNTQLGER